MRDAVQEAGAYERKISREAAITARKELETKMQINDVPPATIAKMRELTKPVADKFMSNYDPAVVKVYRTELEKVHAAVR